MNTVIVYLPPEVCGVLSHAQRHLDAANEPRTRYRTWQWRERRNKHLSKVQKLVSRAVKLLNGRTVYVVP